MNGSLIEEFPLERGLRQRDPISPFLFFLLAAVGVNVNAGLYRGYHVGHHGGVCLSHLQFADDILILGEKLGLMCVTCGLF